MAVIPDGGIGPDTATVLYAVAATTDWSGSTWSLTPGGTGNQAPPTASQTAVLDNNSVSMIMSSGGTCAALVCDGSYAGDSGTYSGTLTFTGGQTLTVVGTVKFTGGMSLAGTGTLTCGSPLDFSGLTFPGKLTLPGGGAYVLNSNITVTGLFSAVTTGVQFNGYTLTLNGGWTGGGAGGSGSTNYVLGGGTITSVIYSGTGIIYLNAPNGLTFAATGLEILNPGTATLSYVSGCGAISIANATTSLRVAKGILTGFASCTFAGIAISAITPTPITGYTDVFGVLQ